MSKKAKLLARLRDRNRDRSWQIKDLEALLESLGFSLVRISGSHHIYVREKFPPINIQPTQNRMAKEYQVKQIRNIILGGQK